jgi:hypothetical protein
MRTGPALVLVPALGLLAASAAADEEAWENDARFHGLVRAVVGQYESWGRVDDEGRWAPWLCRMPFPASAHFSASGDGGTHGMKLYTVYALDPVAYGAQPTAMPTGTTPPAGVTQALVKESFHPRLIEEIGSTDPHTQWQTRGHRLRPAARDGRYYEAGEPAGLYLMMRLRNATAATDQGWVYATVTPDRQTITAAGRLSRCMACHVQEADRLFGLPGGPH